MYESIKLVRVDFRLIHGQVITKWNRLVSANRIVVVNDALTKDLFMAEIYKMAAPPGVAVEVVSIDSFVDSYNNKEFESVNDSIMVLFKDIDSVLDTVERGVLFSQLQIGGLGSAGGKKSVVKGISISKEDGIKLNKIQERKIPVTFQVTPEEPKVTLEKAIEKIGGL